MSSVVDVESLSVVQPNLKITLICYSSSSLEIFNYTSGSS
jgi:hypothetical protein